MASRSSLRRQAQNLANLRYNPEVRGLETLLSQAGVELNNTIIGSKRGAGALRAAISQARPQVRNTYNTAQHNLAGIYGDYSAPGSAPSVNRDLAGLGSSDIVHAALAEQAASKGAITSAKAAALNDLSSQAVQASQGAAYEQRAAREQYHTDATKVLQQLQGIQSDKGLYTATQLGDLLDKAAGRAVTKRGQTLAHKDRQASLTHSTQTTAATEDDKYLTKYGMSKQDFLNLPPAQRQKLAASHSGKKPPSKWLAPKDQAKVQDGIGSAVAQAMKLRGTRNRHEAAGLLTMGRPAQSIKDPKSGQTVKVPAIPTFSQLYASVGLDIAYDGHISRNNVKRLHQRGIKVNALGYPTKAPQIVPSGNFLHDMLDPQVK